jgi:hypothetical protein
MWHCGKQMEIPDATNDSKTNPSHKFMLLLSGLGGEAVQFG